MIDSLDPSVVDQFMATLSLPESGPKSPLFIPSRYPVIYGCDWVREHSNLDITRAVAEAIVRNWAREQGIDPVLLFMALADRLLTKRGITRT